MEKIKIIIRKDLPETNSSSSHSLSICMDEQYNEVGNLQSKVDEEGYLHVDSRDFGREWDKFNDPYTKIQYAAGLVCSRSGCDGSSHSRLAVLEKVICSFTGFKGVIFDWIPDYYQHLMEIAEDEKELKYWNEPNWPSVDHQSTDLIEDVWESEETLKEFIFNPKSWLYLGSDESDPPSEDFYEDSEKSDSPKATISAFFPDPIGRVDDQLSKFPIDIADHLNRYSWTDLIFDNFQYDSKTGKFEVREGDRFSRASGSKYTYQGLDEDSNCHLKYTSENYVKSLIEGKESNEFILVPFTVESEEFGKCI